MKTIFYKVVDIWCKYPFQQEIDYRYVEFYEKRGKKFFIIHTPFLLSNTTIQEKETFLKENLGFESVKVLKIK